jgi:hypothetical protein
MKAISWKSQLKCTSWIRFFTDNIYSLGNRTAGATNPYWRQIGLIHTQFKGLLNGTNTRLAELGRPMLRELDLWILQSAGDLDDLAEVLGSPPGVARNEVGSLCRRKVRRISAGKTGITIDRDRLLGVSLCASIGQESKRRDIIGIGAR